MYVKHATQELETAVSTQTGARPWAAMSVRHSHCCTAEHALAPSGFAAMAIVRKTSNQLFGLLRCAMCCLSCCRPWSPGPTAVWFSGGRCCAAERAVSPAVGCSLGCCGVPPVFACAWAEVRPCCGAERALSPAVGRSVSDGGGHDQRKRLHPHPGAATQQRQLGSQCDVGGGDGPAHPSRWGMNEAN